MFNFVVCKSRGRDKLTSLRLQLCNVQMLISNYEAGSF